MSLAPAVPTAKFDVEAADKAIGVRPETAVRLMKICNDDSATPQQIEEIIDADPSMAARTLKLANSALYGMRSKIARIERAVTMLGRITVAKLASSASMQDAFTKIKLDIPGMTPDTPWNYSVAVAFATEIVVEHCTALTSVAQRKLGAEAFVAGLIHDIGILAQATLAKENFTQAVQASVKTGIPLVNHEKRILGIDHAEVGMRLAKHWDLPSELQQAIGYHHDPHSGDEASRMLTCVVHVALQLVRKADTLSYDGDTDMCRLEPAMEHLRLDPLKAESLVSAIRTRISNIEL